MTYICVYDNTSIPIMYLCLPKYWQSQDNQTILLECKPASTRWFPIRSYPQDTEGHVYTEKNLLELIVFPTIFIWLQDSWVCEGK